MGRPVPIPALGPLRTFQVKLVVGTVTIQGSCKARSPWEIDEWFAKRFAGCGRPTITEVTP